MTTNTSVEPIKLHGSDLAIEVHWTQEPMPQLDSVVFSPNRVQAADIQEVISTLCEVLADGRKQLMLKNQTPIFRG